MDVAGPTDAVGEMYPGPLLDHMGGLVGGRAQARLAGEDDVISDSEPVRA